MSQAATAIAEALRRVEGGRARPWLLVIGPPGSGKTTALLNCGLRLEPQPPSADDPAVAIRIADEAVLVDTAGSLEEADPDNADWLGLIEALRRRNPRRPIDAILIVVAVDWLMTAELAGVDRLAESLRRRLAAFASQTRGRPPIHVLFSKADRIAGFVEFFDDIAGSTSSEARRWMPGSPVLTASGPSAGPRHGRAVDAIAGSLAARCAARLQAEPNPRRRSLILGFPTQFVALHSPVLRLLDGVFGPGPDQGLALAGVSFASSVQQGASVERLAAGVGVAPGAGPVMAAFDRPYFLGPLMSRLLREAAGASGAAPGPSSTSARLGPLRGRRLRNGMLACIGVATVVGLAAMGARFASERERSDRQVRQAQADRAQDLAARAREAGPAAPPRAAAAANGALAAAPSSIDELQRLEHALASSCEAVTREYPFSATASRDADPAAVRALFGDGPDQNYASVTRGVQRWLEDPAAPVWRWNAPAAATRDPEAARNLQRARAIGDIVGPGGLRLRVQARGFGRDVKSATLAIGTWSHTFTPQASEAVDLSWAPGSAAGAGVRFDGEDHAPFVGSGPWALIRLFALARPQSDGTLEARFDRGPLAWVDFRLTVLSPRSTNAFSEPWAFTCPSRL
ncbi:MAG TPA: type VI secretion protein IcmF/TssM N-terminal domain-containing protein [Caulobacteraceae bacterium]|jgi:type VI protein secretion system component VasK|nr:type VI secretion protein IcmF/TssM N-terminal domain-containing protein [Caulobacteraceae bacterium]